MSNCFWNVTKLCAGECECKNYTPVNSEKGRKLNKEYSQDLNFGVLAYKKMVKEKWKLKLEIENQA